MGISNIFMIENVILVMNWKQNMTRLLILKRTKQNVVPRVSRQKNATSRNEHRSYCLCKAGKSKQTPGPPIRQNCATDTMQIPNK